MRRPTDEQIDSAIGMILRIGVIIAAAIVILGGAAYVFAHHSGTVSYQKFNGQPPQLNSMSKIVSKVAALDPLFVIQFGLIVLMATPVIRVVACAVGFGLARDWKYVAISTIVLALLLVSLIGHSG